MSYVQIGHNHINTANIAFIHEHGMYIEGVQPPEATIYFTGGTHLFLIGKEATKALAIPMQPNQEKPT
jgi:hypothetical protein